MPDSPVPPSRPEATQPRSQLFARKSIDKLISDSERPETRSRRRSAPGRSPRSASARSSAPASSPSSAPPSPASSFDTPTILNTPLIHYVVPHTALAGRPGAGPAIALSMILVAFVCALTGLCYAELASMIPIAGSAYTYTYATLGELIAWIIGWDLILEYAGSNMSVSVGFAAHVVDLLDWFGLHPARDGSRPPILPSGLQDLAGQSLQPRLALRLQHPRLPHRHAAHRRSGARHPRVRLHQQHDGAVKLVAILIFVFAVISFIHPSNWHPFMPNGWSGVLTGGSIIFFTYIGFDSVSTAAEECRNPQRDLPIGIIATLVVCTVLYVAVAVCLRASSPGNRWSATLRPSSTRSRSSRSPWRPPAPLDSPRRPPRRAHGHDLVHPRLPDRPVARLVLHVPRRPAAQRLLQRPSALPHAGLLHLGRRIRRRHPLRPLRHRHPRRPLQHRHALRLRPRLHRRHRPSLSATPIAAAASSFPADPSSPRSASSSASCSWPACPSSPGTASSSGSSSACSSISSTAAIAPSSALGRVSRCSGGSRTAAQRKYPASPQTGTKKIGVTGSIRITNSTVIAQFQRSRNKGPASNSVYWYQASGEASMPTLTRYSTGHPQRGPLPRHHPDRRHEEQRRQNLAHRAMPQPRCQSGHRHFIGKNQCGSPATARIHSP